MLVMLNKLIAYWKWRKKGVLIWRADYCAEVNITTCEHLEHLKLNCSPNNFVWPSGCWVVWLEMPEYVWMSSFLVHSETGAFKKHHWIVLMEHCTHAKESHSQRKFPLAEVTLDVLSVDPPTYVVRPYPQVNLKIGPECGKARILQDG